MLTLRIWFWWKLADVFTRLDLACVRRANRLEAIEQERLDAGR